MSTTRRAACGACQASRPPPCSDARSMWLGPIAARSKPRSAAPTGIQLNYAMRYLLRMIFNLAIDQDDDGNAAGGRGKTAPAAEERRVRTVVPAPKHALKQNGIAERAITKRYEQAVRSVGPSQPFPASEAGQAFSPRFPR